MWLLMPQRHGALWHQASQGCIFYKTPGFLQIYSIYILSIQARRRIRNIVCFPPKRGPSVCTSSSESLLGASLRGSPARHMLTNLMTRVTCNLPAEPRGKIHYVTPIPPSLARTRLGYTVGMRLAWCTLPPLWMFEACSCYCSDTSEFDFEIPVTVDIQSVEQNESQTGQSVSRIEQNVIKNQTCQD